MPDTNSLHDDLQFVRSAVDRSRHSVSPAVIWYLWAAISLVGFTLIDLRPQLVGLYWLVAAPVGFILSIWLASRTRARLGEINRATSRRWFEHWGALLVAVIVLILAGAIGGLDGRTIGLGAMLLTAVAYYTAGIHLESKLRWIGLVMILAVPALLFLQRWGWTATGVVLTVALLLTGLTSAREARNAG